ncbi:MAG: PD40 domain-containing protein [Archangium sp.]|nr:PD40 domain-containing protein [Archangium sp.]
MATRKKASKPNAKSAAKSGAKSGAQSGVKSAAKAGAKSGAKPVAKSGATPLAKSGAKSSATSDATKFVAKSGAKPAAKSGAKPVAKSGAKSGGPVLLHPFLHRTELIAIGASPDGKHLATGSFVGEDYDAGGDLLIWELATARVVNHFKIRGGVGWPDYAGCIQWSPDGKRLAIAADTNGIITLDPFALKSAPLDELYVTDGWSRPPSFTWSSDSKRVFVSCWRSSWDPKTRKPIPPLQVPDVPGCMSGVNEDITWMVPGIPEGAWRGSDNDANDNAAGRHIEPPRLLRWADGRILCAGSHSQVFVIDAKTRKLVWLDSAVGSVALHASGKWIALARGRVELWNHAGERQTWATFEDTPGVALHWSPDGKRLAVIDGEDEDTPNSLAIYDVDFGNRVMLLGRIDAVPRARGMWPGDFDPFSWGPNSDAVAFIDDDDRIQVWNVAPTPKLRTTLEAPESKGLLWAPSERLIAWSGRALHFIAPVEGARLTSRMLFDFPSDDGPFGSERLRQHASSQFPLGKSGARVWGALVGDALIVPAGHEAEADELIGWANGKTSANIDSAAVKRFATLAEAVRQAPQQFPTEVRDAHGGGAKVAPSWGISVEPRELFDLWALIELEAAEVTDAWRVGWYGVMLGKLYHRVGNDDAALKALDRCQEWHTTARVRLELALTCAVRGELDRARRYASTVDAAMLARADEVTVDLKPSRDALRGALQVLLERNDDGRLLIEAAEKDLQKDQNRSDKRFAVAIAWLAVGDVDKALEHTKRLDRRNRIVLGEVVPRGLADFRTFAKALVSNDFDVLHATVGGFISLGAFDDAFECLAWFPGLSTDQAREWILEEGVKRNFETAREFVTLARQKAKNSEQRLGCVREMAKIDSATAKEWLDAESGTARAMSVAGAVLGSAAHAQAAFEAGDLDSVVAALEADARMWPLLGDKAMALADERKNAQLFAGLAAAASKAGAAEALARARAQAIEALDLTKHWDVGSVASRLARGGDDDGAFAVLQRLPKSNRSYAIPEVAMAMSERLREKPESRVWAAVYGLLAALPTGNLGSGGRAFETSRVIRRVTGWPRAEWDGLLD